MLLNLYFVFYEICIMKRREMLLSLFIAWHQCMKLHSNTLKHTYHFKIEWDHLRDSLRNMT